MLAFCEMLVNADTRGKSRYSRRIQAALNSGAPDSENPATINSQVVEYAHVNAEHLFKALGDDELDVFFAFA